MQPASNPMKLQLQGLTLTEYGVFASQTRAQNHATECLVLYYLRILFKETLLKTKVEKEPTASILKGDPVTGCWEQ